MVLKIGTIIRDNNKGRYTQTQWKFYRMKKIVWNDSKRSNNDILQFSQDEPPAENIGLFWSAFKISYLLNRDIFHVTGISLNSSLFPAKIADTVFSLKTGFNPLSASLRKWSNTLKKFVGNLPTNCLSVFDHFMRLKGLRKKLRVFPCASGPKTQLGADGNLGWIWRWYTDFQHIYLGTPIEKKRRKEMIKMNAFFFFRSSTYKVGSQTWFKFYRFKLKPHWKHQTSF